MKISGTRVDYGAKAGSSKDQQSGNEKTPGGMSGQTNAKRPVSKTESESRVTVSETEPTTRKTTGAK